MWRPLFWVLPLLAFLSGRGVLAAGLDWRNGNGFRSARLNVPTIGKTGFTSMTPDRTGIGFTNSLSVGRSITNQIYLNGSGVALGDVDGDGWCDIYLCSLENGNRLYRNRGDWHFEDITEGAGVACQGQASTGAALADIDGDGDLDLLVNSIGNGVRLFLNDGHGHFRESTATAGLTSHAGGTSLALADVDGDGYLDLYAVNYRTHTLRDEPGTRFKVATTNGVSDLVAVDGRPVTDPDLAGRFTVGASGEVLENGEPDVLYRNDGHGRFIPVPWTEGAFLDAQGQRIKVPHDWGLSAMFRDLNGDGAPDLYVCNDFQSEDRLWINDGHGHFHPPDPLAIRHTSLFSMGIDFADIDRDGLDDFVVVDMLSRSHRRRQVQVADRKAPLPTPGQFLDRPQYSRNMLFWNRGDQTYAEIAQLSGVAASDWSWCPVFVDVDLDGFEDLLMVTGHQRDAMNIDISRSIESATRSRALSRLEQLQLRKAFPVYDSPNFAFRNHGDLTFEEVGAAWGFDSTQISQGIALADLDNDGDLDVVINCLNAAPLLYRNEAIAPRVAIRLRGSGANTAGIGAKIRVLGGSVPMQSQEMISGGRYLSSDDPMRVFAAGTLTNLLRVEVLWREGDVSLATNLEVNHLYEIDQSAATRRAAPKLPPSLPTRWFEDVSQILGHRHRDTPFDDFQRQPLLPKSFSQGGPGISCYDWNGDGWDDLIIGAGRDGTIAVFRNDTHGGFVPVREPPFDGVATRDQTTVLGAQLTPGRRVLLAGMANYEDGQTNGAALRAYNLSNQIVVDVVSAQSSSTGPISLVDADGDGDLDIFVGGQIVSGRYPEPASSLLLIHDQGKFQLDAVAGDRFRQLGVVNSVVWTDIDGDGLPELVAACEWGPIRVFTRRAGQWVEITRTLGLEAFSGWWLSVQAVDLDGDGKMDIVAGNWGRNSPYQSVLDQPLRLFAGDVNGSGAWELMEAYYSTELKKVVPLRDWESLAGTMPFIRDRYHSFTEFSAASAIDVLGDHLREVREFQVNTLDSMVFMNRGDHFEARRLPLEAQLAPVFGLVVADFDGDGHEDLFLNQNFFGVRPGESRYDAGRGALLRGGGDGTFETVPASDSGIAMDGEGRGAAALDYDHDGRVDLVAGQNSGATRMFHNRNAKPGLRVKVQGPAGNPEGIGAQLAVVYRTGRHGPTRELHAGSGYWSQDAAVPILGLAEEPRAVAVRWPGGKTTETPVPPGATEIIVRW